MARPVVVGVDGSPESLTAVEWAAEEAVLRRQPLSLIHVWGCAPSPTASSRAAQDQQNWGESFLREAAHRVETLHPDLELSALLQPGVAAEVLLRVAPEADLLVLGSRGVGRLLGFLVGSVALSVVAAAPRPVVLVRATGPGPEPSGTRDVILGVDLDHRTGDLFEFAYEAARMRQSPLTVIYAYPIPSPYGVAPGESLAVTMPDMFAESYQRLLDALSPWQEKNPDVEVRPIVEPGHAASAVLDAAHEASLCIVGRRLGTHWAGAHLGSVAHGVMHHAACPVAVVPHA